MWASPKLLAEPTIGGGSARSRGGGGGGHRSQISLPSRPKYAKMAKNGRFPHILAYKLPKTPFFVHNYLTRYTQETFFEEYMNFEAHYLSCCRDISLQSFGSHIRPQLHGLGLTEDTMSIPNL
jgi:hypothetical protein